MSSPDATARNLGRETLGLVRISDLVEAGVAYSTIRRKVTKGEWERPHRRVVDVTLARWSWRRRVLAAVLDAPRGTVATHRTAAALHRFPGFERRGGIEVLVPRSARNREMTITVHSTTLPATAIEVDDVPCTTLGRTLHGLAASGDARGCARGVRHVLRRGDLGVDDLLEPRLAPLPGRQLLERTVRVEAARLHAAVDSALEEAWIDRLLSWRLPPFVTQHPLTVEGHRYRLDIAWPEHRVALEGDGDGFHGDHRSQDADGRRRERIGRDRWAMTRVGWSDLKGAAADRVLRRLRHHLRVE